MQPQRWPGLQPWLRGAHLRCKSQHWWLSTDGQVILFSLSSESDTSVILAPKIVALMYYCSAD
eukprot:scaffold374296_cov42-Prasinocladus_malaysianus.AAC.2